MGKEALLSEQQRQKRDFWHTPKIQHENETAMSYEMLSAAIRARNGGAPGAFQGWWGREGVSEGGSPQGEGSRLPSAPL